MTVEKDGVGHTLNTAVFEDLLHKTATSRSHVTSCMQPVHVRSQTGLPSLNWVLTKTSAFASRKCENMNYCTCKYRKYVSLSCTCRHRV